MPNFHHFCDDIGCSLYEPNTPPTSEQAAGYPDERHEDIALKFDVASIHELAPSAPARQHLNNPSHVGRLDAVMRLSQLIAEAFGVNFRYQLAGVPDWLDRENFGVHASSDEEVSRRLASLPDEEATADKRRMLLQLLQNRFRLQYHIEERPGLTYFLTSVKSAANLISAAEESDNSGISSGGPITDLVVTGHGAKMSQFAGLMSYYLKAPVADQTNLNGTYNFTVHFNASSELPTADIDFGLPPDQALAEQMGLKLLRGKAPVQTIVVDSVEKPSPN
ncbi:TIGR03435 family protein [Terriglobus roseus]|uniref:Soil-associated protein, TIGR03435 family n=1 Tax=Terriglobus roseus TaxID=392734 RepID=A0A1G7HJA9_9BACT|nr:TIGR03435 family protein [Terriglobus roseus]SDF00413.1 soil-associated protein, TIGR03435 family [Terriglobus roseus]